MFALSLVAALSGCQQSDQDEEKEPHFVLGQSRINAMDYQGAVEAFEESLEVNPHSAAAHYQLGMLYENQESDPAAAIYHYEQYLKYDPSAENADIIRQHITGCKQQLASDVMQLPTAPGAQAQLEKLVEQNRQLQQQVDSLRATLQQWGDWYSNQQATAKSMPVVPQNTYVAPQQPQPQLQTPVTAPYTAQVTPTPPAHLPPGPAVTPLPPRNSGTGNANGHTHTVEHGETAMAICRKYGIKLNELETANPTMNPTKIHVGQVLNIP